jgi:hypothetical protein
VTIHLYLDEDAMDTALVRALRARGVDVVTAREVDRVERPDEEHLIHADRDNRVLYSFNVGDFQRIHRNYMTEGKAHSGIILARQQEYSVGEQTRRLLRLISENSAESMRNRVEFLSAWT